MNTLKKKALFALLSLYFLAPAINFNSVFDFNVFQNMLASALSLIILISLILFKVEINLFVLNKSFIISFFVFLLILFISSVLNGALILLGKDLSFYLNLFLFYLIIIILNNIYGKDSIIRFTNVSIITGGTLVVLLGFLQISGVNLFNFINADRPGSSLDNRTFASEYIVCIYPFFLYIFYNSLRTFTGKTRFIILFLLLTLFTTYIFLLRTRAAYVSFLIVTLVYLILNFSLRKNLLKKNLIFTLLLSIIIMVSIFISNSSYFKKDPDRINLSENITSIFNPTQNEKRLNYWKSSLEMFSDKPIFGIGTGMWFGQYPMSKGLKDRINSEAITDENVYFNSDLNPHNIYLEFLSENGIVGLIAFLLIIIPVFYSLLRSSLRKEIFIPAFLSLLSFLIIGFFTFTKDNFCVMIIVFLVLAISSHEKNIDKIKVNKILSKLFLLILTLISFLLFYYSYSRFLSEKRYISALNLKARVDYINMNIEMDKICNWIYPADVNNMPLDYYRGVGYYEQKEYIKSLNLFNSALKLAPEIALISNNLAAAYYQTGNIDSAKSIFLNLKKYYPSYIEPQINLLSLYMNTYNYDSAKMIIKVIEEKSFNKEFVKNYSVFISVKEFLK